MLFFTFHILLELRVNLTVRGHFSVFLLCFVIFTGVMRREKGGKRGKKKKMEERQEEREKEGGELEEMTEERTEEGTEERIERKA